MTSNTRSYLIPGRLEDVLTLIQLLAYGPHARRTEDGLQKELNSTPKSSKTWFGVAEAHAEFFRIRADLNEPIVALVARFARDAVQAPNGEKLVPPLDAETANKLMEIAVELHDREAEGRDRWRHVGIPIIVSGISAAVALGLALYTQKPIEVKLAAPSIYMPK